MFGLDQFSIAASASHSDVGFPRRVVGILVHVAGVVCRAGTKTPRTIQTRSALYETAAGIMAKEALSSLNPPS